MGLWGLLAQGIQDTVGWITGAATGTSQVHQAKHQMETADRDIANQERMLQHQMFVDERNYQHTREAYEYQKQLQQQLFAREDNSVQRRTADLKAAGINPILAAGQGAGAGSPIGVTAPHQAVTGKAVSMSPKLQALAMQQDMQLQLKARSVQISQMAAHAELLHEQAKHERAKTEEAKTHAAEMIERSKGYEGQRDLIKEQAKHTRRSTEQFDYTEKEIIARTNRIIEETRGDRIENNEMARNFRIAEGFGIRSDLKYSRYANDIMQAVSFTLKTYGFSDHKQALNHAKDYFIKTAGELARGNISSIMPAPIRNFITDTAEAIRTGISENEIIQRFLGFIRAINDNTGIETGSRAPAETLRERRDGPNLR